MIAINCRLNVCILAVLATIVLGPNIFKNRKDNYLVRAGCGRYTVR